MASVLDNMSVRQRALVSREVAREYGAWRKRYGEPSKRDRDIILARGFGAARKKDPRIPMPNGLSKLAAGAVGGAVGAVVAGALANPRRHAPKPSLRGWEVYDAFPDRKQAAALVGDLRSGHVFGYPVDAAWRHAPGARLKYEVWYKPKLKRNPLVELPAAPTVLGPASAVPMVNPFSFVGPTWAEGGLSCPTWVIEAYARKLNASTAQRHLWEKHGVASEVRPFHGKWALHVARPEAHKAVEALRAAHLLEPKLGTNPRDPRSGKFEPRTASDVFVDIWSERDRLHIALKDKATEKIIAEWWDEDAQQMFEDGFFESGPGLKQSVIRYAEDMGIIKKWRMNPLLMTVMGANPLTEDERAKLRLRSGHFSATSMQYGGERTKKGNYFSGRSDEAWTISGRFPQQYSDNPRAVHEDIVEAFFSHRPRSIGPRYRTDGRELRVWGNLVAEWRPEGLYVTDAGWRTLLTRNVLNQVLLEAFRRGYQGGVLYQKKFGWYFEPFGPDGRPIPSKKIEWKGGMVIGMASVAPVAVPAANPGGCPPMCLNPMHEHKKKPRSATEKARWRALKRKVSWLERTSVTKLRRDYERRHRGRTNPARRSKRITMTLAEFARRVKKTGDKRLWAAFLKKIEGYKKWTHGTLPKKVTVEMLDVPGVNGTWITYDAGREPEARYEMPKGSKRKGAWRHPWDTPPKISHDPEAGIVLKKLGGRSKITDFYHR